MVRHPTGLALWTAAGAAVAVAVSVLTLLLPPGLGGYDAWSDPHLFVYNIAAMLTRVAVFALIGATLAGAWHNDRWSRR
jgi:hypothetical protein